MKYFLVLLAASPAIAQTFDPFVAPERGFTSWQPAQNWEHSLLTGNGTMGAMVIGQPHAETVILSHNQLYIPVAEPKTPIDQASRLSEIRKLIIEGKGSEAAKIPVALREKEGFTQARDPFIPAFEVKIEQEPSNITKYQRSVNFSTGEATVAWQDGKGTFSRTVFASRPDSVIIISIKGTTKINASFHLEMVPYQWTQSEFVKRNVAETKIQAEGSWLNYRCRFKNNYKDGLQGYEGLGKLIVFNGKSETQGNKVKITDADEVLLLIKIRPTRNYSTSGTETLKREIDELGKSYENLLSKHIAIHGALFNRSKLSLNASKEARLLHAEELLLLAKQTVSPALIEKVYDAGRYNILSSTGTNPPNLQGLWSGTWSAPWNGDFTHDGNLATAVASLFSGNMPELMEAFFAYHERYLPTYRENANRLYGAGGIRIPAHTSNSGLDTDFGDIWCLTFWNGAAGWTSKFFYDYYLYTGDFKFLKERAYPFMKESAQFFEDFLTKDKNGKLIFNPSYSPENNPSNNPSQATINATMDIMIAKQLFRNCIATAKLLKTDQDKVKLWATILASLPEYEVAKDGSLREWLWAGLEENHAHRHSSQLYALYDGVDPDFKQNPILLTAANRTVDEKMKFRIKEGGGEMAFGLVQLGLVAAHLHEAEKAGQLVNWLSSKYWSTGMGSFHNVGELFNTDISGGLPAVIIEMLAQSEVGKLEVLPALPSAWETGTIEGVGLRGQVVLNKLSWAGKSVELKLYSRIDQNIELKFPHELKSHSGAKLNKIRDECYSVKLLKGKEVKLLVELK
ncbi:glycosyl hydrolase family 95 catalytic domain-containing protein [Desertivirga brevis]|uniref:glycosyl hydrolase family 95 catalytic domain-containing protein n=1 Tax=Desertivirga brevis TaxID=2810310 RepID=UPI001A96ECA0|nr:glycoside hydrolase N-terminal domain-containing protein [Pedobacter sp. SYSU D00873]